MDKKTVDIFDLEGSKSFELQLVLPINRMANKHKIADLKFLFDDVDGLVGSGNCFFRRLLTLTETSLWRLIKFSCKAVILISLCWSLAETVIALIKSPLLMVMRVMRRFGIFPVITCSGEGRIPSLFDPSQSNLAELIIVGIAIISFQSYGAKIRSNIIDLSATSTVRIRDSTVPFAHGEYITVGLCRMW